MGELGEMHCSVVARWKGDTGGMTTETAQRVVAAWMNWKRCSGVVRWKDDTGGMTTESAQRVIAAWVNWKRCSVVSCDGRMIQEA